MKIISVMVTAAVVISTPCTNVSAMRLPEAVRHDIASGSGFTLKSVERSEAFDATVYVYEHTETGAVAEFIRNDDPNKFFMLEFETPAEDNKGIAHVLEHSVMGGSHRFPSRSLSMALFNRTYITYGNAVTQDRCTIYPIASLSEKQLLKFAEYYSDICFDPLILEDENIFRSEAWRYSLTDSSSPLTIKGTVYSEMTGRYTAERAAYRKAISLISPGSPSSYESGGIPDDILTLSYDEVKDFYRRYYLPSGCTAYMYGNIRNIDAFLELLDKYFSGYDRPTGSTDAGTDTDTGELHAGGTKTAEEAAGSQHTDGELLRGYYYFPSRGAGDLDMTEMVYALQLGRPSDEELCKLTAFASYCNYRESLPMLILKSIYPFASFSFGVENDRDASVFFVKAHGMSEDEELFAETIDAVFADIKKEHIPEEELEAFRRQKEREIALCREGTNAPYELLADMAEYHSAGRGEYFYINMLDDFSDMSWFTDELVGGVIDRYLSGGHRRALSAVTADDTAASGRDSELRQKLSAMKASMTDAETEELIADTKRITEYATDDASEYIKELSVTTVSDLSEKTQQKVTDTTGEDGIRRISVRTDNDNMTYTKLMLDASGISADMLGYLALYVDLVNGHFIGTENHSRDEISAAIGKCTAGGQTISLAVSETGSDYVPYVTVDFMCGADEADAAYDLAYERLFAGDFSDPVSIKEGIGAIRSTIAANITNHPETVARYIACSDDNGAAYYEYTHYMEYYDFLAELEERIGGDYKNICEKLAEAGRYVNCAKGAVMGIAASGKNEEKFRRSSDSFAARLAPGEHVRCDYDFAGLQYPLAIETGIQTVSNVIACPDAGKYTDGDDPALDVALRIIADRYLRENLRDKYGTYAYSYRDDYPAVAVFTGSDMTVAETHEAFAGIGSAWRDIRANITREELDEYILMLYSMESCGAGELAEAAKLIEALASGKSASYKKERLERLCKVTVDGLAGYDVLFDRIAECGRFVTVGDGSLIGENSDTYAQVYALHGRFDMLTY